MTSSKEGLLTDAATAIAATLGRVVHTTGALVDAAKSKASVHPARGAKTVAQKARSRARATAGTAKQAARRGSRLAKRAGKVATQKARRTIKKARRAGR